MSEAVRTAIAEIFDHALASGPMKQALVEGVKALQRTDWEAALRSFGGAHAHGRFAARKAPELGEALVGAWTAAAEQVIGVARDEAAQGRTHNATRILGIVEQYTPYGSDIRRRAGDAARAVSAAADAEGYGAIEAEAMTLARNHRDAPAKAVCFVHEAWLASPLSSPLRAPLAALRAKLLTFTVKRAGQLADTFPKLAYKALADARACAATEPALAALMDDSLRALERRDPSLRAQGESADDDLPELPED